MSEKIISITIKPTSWIFSPNEIYPVKKWKDVEGTGHKVSITLDKNNKPKVSITEHYDETNRNRRNTIYTSDEVLPMSAAEAEELLETVLRQRDYNAR